MEPSDRITKSWAHVKIETFSWPRSLFYFLRCSIFYEFLYYLFFQAKFHTFFLSAFIENFVSVLLQSRTMQTVCNWYKANNFYPCTKPKTIKSIVARPSSWNRFDWTYSSVMRNKYWSKHFYRTLSVTLSAALVL